MFKLSSLVRYAAVGMAVAAPAIAFAQDTTKVKGVVEGTLTIVNVIVTIVFVLAVLVFGWGVVKYIMSAGDPEGEKEARGFLWWGVIGIAVLAFVFGIIQYAATYFGVDATSGGTIKIPEIKGSARP